jgi:hypothetical protein
MWRRTPAPSVIAVIDDERPRRRRATGAAAAGLLIALLVVAPLVVRLFRWIDLDLPDVPLPDVDAPGWLRWVGPVLGAGKLLFLVGLGLLAVLGEWERRRRKDGWP